jgi:hypothetical protein
MFILWPVTDPAVNINAYTNKSLQHADVGTGAVSVIKTGNTL